MSPSSGDLLELVRAPAILTVLGDTLAGGAAAGHAFTPRRAALPLASACFYAGGMALNDWADREIDAVERPERPVPSGRVSPRQALGVAIGLTAAGLALAPVGGGRRALLVAVPLAAAVWTYDVTAKDRAAGPVVMAACRGLDVLLGAGPGHLRAALPAAAALTVHTAGVTVLSRGEVHGTTSGRAWAVATGTVLTTLAAAIPTSSRHGALTSSPGAVGPRSARPLDRALAAGAAVAYAASCLPAQTTAARVPTAARARTATKAGIRAMIPLQAAWAGRHGHPGAVLALGLVEVAGRVLRARSAAAGTQVSET
ncbi:SCO3242 family prenyltransferase [Sanguibacter suaedae]|uniref:UbiA family prenyltransferase n=1 Tax=Sanguibacter suaedae TaxID=2795737 RepID=A0A934M7N0_9MICO|nr:UbiA family prenyltransferase [Sanguibacter suaedae]MBI9115587.1 UbiA family prenyltransferase [Sanguibacter suaedae]